MNRWVRAALVAATRSAVTMTAGLALTCGISLVLWAMTPTSSDGADGWLRGAANTYLLAHFADLRIGAATLTATPLLLTALCTLLLASGARFSRYHRGADEQVSAAEESVRVGVGALTYGVLVAALAFVAQEPAARDGLVGVWAGALAAATLLATTLHRGSGLRAHLSRLPKWWRAGFAASVAVVAMLVAGAATAFVVAMVTAFPRAADLSATLADGAGPGLGLAVIGVGYVPNAIAAGLGYVTGAGFQLGAGRYSPFGSVLTDLPPLPLLAAAPTTGAASPLGLASLVVPLAAAVVAALIVTRLATGRIEQLRAVAVAALSAGAAVALLVTLGSGGVNGGAWSNLGANGLLVGGLVAGSVAVVGATWVLAPYVPLPGRPRIVEKEAAVAVVDSPQADGDDTAQDGDDSVPDGDDTAPESVETAPDGDDSVADGDEAVPDGDEAHAAASDGDATASAGDGALANSEESPQAGADAKPDAEPADTELAGTTSAEPAVSSEAEPAETSETEPAGDATENQAVAIEAAQTDDDELAGTAADTEPPEDHKPESDTVPTRA
jgi:Family of unknown function (DUF6350)